MRFCWLLSLLLVSTGCDSCGDQPAPTRSTKSTSTASATGSALAPKPLRNGPAFTAGDPHFARPHTGEWSARKADGQPLITLRLAGPDATLLCGDSAITSKMRSGSRRYTIEGKSGYYGKIKIRGPLMALSTPGRKRMFLVSIQPHHIHIESQGETFRVERGARGFRIRRGRDWIGSVEGAGPKKTVVKRGTTVVATAEEPQPTVKWVVLLLEKLPEPARCIMFTELAGRGL